MILSYKNKNYELNSEQIDNQWIYSIDGKRIEASLQPISNNLNIITINEKKYSAHVTEDENFFYVSIDGDYFTFKKVKEQEKDYNSSNAKAENLQAIQAPMPGTVIKVLIEKGQKVEEGEPLLIVEAMKMETTLFASILGIITELNVKEGQQVDSDNVLLVIENKENDELLK